MTENEVAKEIVDAAYKVHTTLGPGLFESVYETVMARELTKRGPQVVRQRPIPVVWENIAARPTANTANPRIKRIDLPPRVNKVLARLRRQPVEAAMQIK